MGLGLRFRGLGLRISFGCSLDLLSVSRAAADYGLLDLAHVEFGALGSRIEAVSPGQEGLGFCGVGSREVLKRICSN